jgi:N-acetylneuraminic acid mutarotase
MVVANTRTNTFDNVEMPQALWASQFLSVAWSASIRKLLVFGGSTGQAGQADMFNAFSYDPSGEWRNINKELKRDIRTPRLRSCLVPAYGGTKMIFFGGVSMSLGSIEAVYSDLYVVDVATMTWKKAPDGPIEDGIASSACAVSNDHFITWGGLSKKGKVSSTYVFNIKTNNWTSTYDPTFPSGGGLKSILSLAADIVAWVLASSSWHLLFGLVSCVAGQSSKLHESSSGSRGFNLQH